MSGAKHTPGPWDDWARALQVRLMAAAPELLEAAYAALDELRFREFNARGEPIPGVTKTIQTLEAAIGKAEDLLRAGETRNGDRDAERSGPVAAAPAMLELLCELRQVERWPAYDPSGAISRVVMVVPSRLLERVDAVIAELEEQLEGGET